MFPLELVKICVLKDIPIIYLTIGSKIKINEFLNLDLLFLQVLDYCNLCNERRMNQLQVAEPLQRACRHQSQDSLDSCIFFPKAFHNSFSVFH